MTLRGGGADYAYPIGKVPGLRGGAWTPEPGESDTRPGDDRLLPPICDVWQAEWVDHLLWASGAVISIGLNAPGGADTLGKMMGVAVRSRQLGSGRWRRSGINESKQSKEQKGEERSEKRGILGGLFDKMKKDTGKARPDGHRRAAEGGGGGVVDV